LPVCVALTSLAAEKVAREAACHSFAEVARGLSLDWRIPEDHALDGKQIQRWSERLGESLVRGRQAEIEGLERGIKRRGPLNSPLLMVVGLDGGRVQMDEKDPETKSRWKEDKVASFSSYLPGMARTRLPRSW
jgi:hypothetical protein